MEFTRKLVHSVLILLLFFNSIPIYLQIQSTNKIKLSHRELYVFIDFELYECSFLCHFSSLFFFCNILNVFVSQRRFANIKEIVHKSTKRIKCSHFLSNVFVCCLCSCSCSLFLSSDISLSALFFFPRFILLLLCIQSDVKEQMFC